MLPFPLAASLALFSPITITIRIGVSASLFGIDFKKTPPRPFHDLDTHPYYAVHPSPPPITTLTASSSPSLSSDRSSVSSPAPTILPPLAHQVPSHGGHPYLSAHHQQNRYAGLGHAQHHSSGYSQHQSQHQHALSQHTQGAYHASGYYPSGGGSSSTVSPPDVFAAPAPAYTHYASSSSSGYPSAPPTHNHAHNHLLDPQQYAHQQNAYAPMHAHAHSYHSGHSGHSGGGGGGLGLGGVGGGGGGGGGGGSSSAFQPIYTDDAATKLSDRVRRRCFNCCTTDTSTWRRSSLNPGKVVSFFFFKKSSLSPPLSSPPLVLY